MNILKWMQIAKYGRFFTKERFFATVKKMKMHVALIKKALVLYYCMRDQETPKYVKVILLGALGYFILPIDIFPDSLPGIGTLDDLVIITAAYKFANRYIKPIHVEKAIAKIPFGENPMP